MKDKNNTNMIHLNLVPSISYNTKMKVCSN